MGNLPFFFPTRVVLVDDEPQVLRMTALLFLQCPQVAEVVTFDNGPDALAYVQGESARAPRLDAFAAARVEDDYALLTAGGGPVRRTVHLQLDELDGVLDEPLRRALVSVIVCDYAMPGMDGLAFFEALALPSVRRVMLTALCDEHRAVQAFNRGLIHQFVHKADPAGPRGLEAMIAAQTRAYFRHRTGHLAAALALGEATRALQHPAVDAVLETALAERACTEFAAGLAPLGFRLGGAGRRAQPGTLLLATGEAFDRAARAVEEIDGPADLAAALRDRSVMPTGDDGAPLLDGVAAGESEPEGDAAVAVRPWAARAVAPRVAGGDEPLYWALIAPRA